MKPIIFFGVLVLSTAASQATAATLRVSCFEGGRHVYREVIETEDPAEKRLMISAQHPNAMCVFLDVDERKKPTVAGALPDRIIAAAAGNAKFDDKELAAALSAIAGKRVGEAYAITERASRTDAKSLSKDVPLKVGLVLGTYRDVPVASVMEHWRIMSEGTEKLARLTPTINPTDKGVLTLSVDGVPDKDAAQVCNEAAQRGVGCVSVY